MHSHTTVYIVPAAVIAALILSAASWWFQNWREDQRLKRELEKNGYKLPRGYILDRSKKLLTLNYGRGNHTWQLEDTPKNGWKVMIDPPNGEWRIFPTERFDQEVATLLGLEPADYAAVGYTPLTEQGEQAHATPGRLKRVLGFSLNRS